MIMESLNATVPLARLVAAEASVTDRFFALVLGQHQDPDYHCEP
jgi:hypothetical protein